LLPPLEILNAILQREEWGSEHDFGPSHPIGSGLSWEPFSLTSEDFRELCRQLEPDYLLVDTPASITTPEAWEFWQRKHGG
jgi:hypothetical protein